MTNPKYQIHPYRKANHPPVGVTVRISENETADINWLTRESLESWLRASESVSPGFANGLVAAMLQHDPPACGASPSPGQQVAASMLELEKSADEDFQVFMAITADSLKHALDAMRLLGVEEYSHAALMATISMFANGADRAAWLPKYFEEASEDGVEEARERLLAATQEEVPS